MNVENMKVKDLIPYEDNAKKHDETQIKNVMESIRQFGFAQPIVVDKDNVIIIGHCRLIASERLHMEEVPVVRMENLTEEEVQKLRLLDNKLNESEWDFDLLADQIPELDFDGFDIDWGIPEIVEEEPEVIEDDVPEEVQTRCKTGDIWQLGDHRLICGDSTDVNIIDRLMDGVKADMVFTDPPYGVDYKGINNDSRDGLSDLLNGAFATAMANTKQGGSVYCFHSDKCADIFQECFRKFCHFSSVIIWKKQSLVLSQTDYQSIHEPCLYGWFENGTHNFYGDRKQTSVWEFDRESIDGHTTPKPIGFIAKALQNSSRKGEVVLDVFGGSGSTMIACEQLGRKCHMCELDPHYCDVIIQRWENLTGKQAVRIEEGDGYVLSEKIDLTDAIKESVSKRKEHGEDDEA